MATSSARIEALRKKQQVLAEQIKKIESRTQEQQRKDDTRRKIIAGALALEHMENNKTSDFAKKLGALLDEYVVKANERELFGLNPKDQKQ